MKAYHIKNKEIIPNIRTPNQHLIAIMAAILLLISPSAYAHKLNMFAYVEGNEIFAEGYFTDGKKAKNSTITVFDPEDNQLLQGTSDIDGQLSFTIPQQSDLRITVNAGMGHQAEYVLLKDELNDDADTPVTPSTPATVLADSNDRQLTNGTTPSPVATLDNDAIRAEVERAVGKAIKPLMRELSSMRAEKSLADIIGGIGFIFGLLGVAMYFKSRKQ